MDSLDAGNHILKVIFNNGGTAQTTFTVTNPTYGDGVSTPNTYDGIVLWVSVLGISAIGLVLCSVKIKKVYNK
jgi:hypothetical protein